jgi:hypothetical protein
MEVRHERDERLDRHDGQGVESDARRPPTER